MSAAKDTAAVSGQDVFEISSKDFVNNTCNPAQRPAYKIQELKIGLWNNKQEEEVGLAIITKK